MNANELKEIMETALPASVLRKAVQAAQFEQRERKRDALKFLRAMLISAASPAGGRELTLELNANPAVRAELERYLDAMTRGDETAHAA